MTIKVKLRGNGKAMVRFSNKTDESFFVFIMRQLRDDGKPHPKISLKDMKGSELPRLPPPKPMLKIEPKKIEPEKLDEKIVLPINPSVVPKASVAKPEDDK